MKTQLSDMLRDTMCLANSQSCIEPPSCKKPNHPSEKAGANQITTEQARAQQSTTKHQSETPQRTTDITRETQNETQRDTERGTERRIETPRDPKRHRETQRDKQHKRHRERHTENTQTPETQRDTEKTERHKKAFQMLEIPLLEVSLRGTSISKNTS